MTEKELHGSDSAASSVSSQNYYYAAGDRLDPETKRLNMDELDAT
jgi:hypothetical protein